VLIRQCKKGNTVAQYQLSWLYIKAMFNIAVRMTGDKETAEDIYQDASSGKSIPHVKVFISA